MRCFAAIELADELRGEIQRVTDAARQSDLRFLPSEKWHITLAFFAAVPQSDVPALMRVLAAASAATPPFELLLDRSGAFPSLARPRVLWIGVKDSANGCELWLAQARSDLAALGFPLEQRPFRPHVTLSRARSATDERAMRQFISSVAPPRPLAMTVRQITLFESRLGRSGSTYAALARFPLAGMIAPGQ